MMAIESPGAFWKDYELIDSGNFEKLERFGKAGKEDSGTWERRKKMDDQWYIRFNGAQEGLNFSLRLGLTSFKHVGVFPEQSSNREYIYKQTRALVEKASEAKQSAVGPGLRGCLKAFRLFSELLHKTLGKV